MKIRNCLLTLGILLALPLVGHAQIIYTDSFEDGSTTGWSDVVVSPGGAGFVIATVPESFFSGNYGSFNGQDGAQYGLINLQGNAATLGGPPDMSFPTAASNDFFNTNVGATFAANTTYTLTYLAAGAGDPGFPSGGILSTSFEAGGTVIGSTTTVAAPANMTDTFATYTLTFDTATNPGVVGQAIGIDTIWNNSAIQYQQENAVDNYQITAISDVPEPSTYALLGAGLLTLAFVSRRKALEA